MRVHWTNAALEHLSAIHDYIAKDSSVYARRMVDRITRRSCQISEFPESGQKVREFDADDIRQVIEPPYRLIYRIGPDQIDVLAVVHGARLLSPDIVDG